MHIVINELGLNPLMVNFNRNFNSDVGIRNLSLLRNIFGADFRQYTLNPLLARKVVRTTLGHLGTLNWLWIAGQTSTPVRVAVEKGIPLIIWGAHQGIEQVGMYSHLDNVEMTRRYRKEHDLMGVDESEIIKYDPDFTRSDLSLISYPSDDDLLSVGVRGIYLGNYFRWDPVAQHAQVAKKFGYLGSAQTRTYYQYDNPDCHFYNNLQDQLKQAKYGYAKVTDQLVRDIRHGRIPRTKAIKTNDWFLEQRASHLHTLADWLGSSAEGLNLLKLSYDDNFSEKILESSRVRKSGRLRKYFKNEGRGEDMQNFGKGIPD
jgi:hypothetical protein